MASPPQSASMPITANPTQATGVREKGGPRAGGFALIIAVAAISTSFPVYRFRSLCISTGFPGNRWVAPTHRSIYGRTLNQTACTLLAKASFRLGGSRGRHDRPSRNPGTPAIDRVGPIPFVGPGLEAKIPVASAASALHGGRHKNRDVRIARAPARSRRAQPSESKPSRSLTDGPGSNQRQRDG